MKILAKNIPAIVDVVVEAYHPILDESLLNSEVVATRDLSDYSIPSGPVISMYKERVTQKMKNDFEAFMEDVEIFCETNCNLIGTYKNVSDDDSYYYNYLATDDEGNIIVKFRLRLRISNHDPKRSKEQKAHKDEETDSEILKDLLSPDQISKLKAYTKLITVNDSEYTNYESAAEDVFDTIESAVECMKRDSKYRPKVAVPKDFPKDKYKELYKQRKEKENADSEGTDS